MANWKEYRLGDIINVKHGYAFKGEYFSDSATSDILLTPGNFKIGGGFKADKFKYYNGEYPNDYILNEGDIVITMTDLSKEGDTLGYSAKIPEHNNIRYLHNQRLGLMQLKDDRFDKNFLYWALRTKIYQQFIVSSATGTTVKHTSPSRICDYKFKAPEKNTQTAIAEILSSLDDKIELNNQINKNLEALAQALFKQWFVDFEFPNENGQPYKSSGGEMVESELGEIPKGWSVRYLNEITDCFDSKRIPLSSLERENRKGAYPYYGASGIIDFIDGYLFDGVYVLLSEDGENLRSRNTPIAFEASGKFWVNNHAHILQGKIITTELLLCFLQNVNVSHLLTGAVQPKLSQANMNLISMALPNDLSFVENVENIMKGIFSIVREHVNENYSLSSLRNTLLPKLISGELEVQNV